MKKTILISTALMGLSHAAYAGGMAEGLADPVVMPIAVVEEESGSSGSFVIPLLLLAVIAAVATAGGGSSGHGHGPS